MLIKSSIYNSLLKFPAAPPEAGGILGMRDGIICAFEKDQAIQSSDFAIYKPNTAYLNSVIASWSQNNIAFCGIVHTHPEGQTDLSDEDKIYIKKIIKHIGTFSLLYFPIVISGNAVFSFCAQQKENTIHIRRDKITLID